MATPHIEAGYKGAIAKTVLMPGDPLRAKVIADEYLEDAVLVNTVRNMLAFTGFYNGRQITVMGSGMGMPSIGIYSYELFNYYNVENIIRVGSCGAYAPELNIYDVIIATKAYSESSYARTAFNYPEVYEEASMDLNNKLHAAAEKTACPVISGIIHSSDVFYRHFGGFQDIYEKYGCIAVEMESFALFANARFLKKQAACILTVSDSLVTKQETTSAERQNSFRRMMEIALESVK